MERYSEEKGEEKREKEEWWVRKEEERSWNKCKDGNSQIGEGNRQEGRKVMKSKQKGRETGARQKC